MHTRRNLKCVMFNVNFPNTFQVSNVLLLGWICRFAPFCYVFFFCWKRNIFLRSSRHFLTFHLFPPLFFFSFRGSIRTSGDRMHTEHTHVSNEHDQKLGIHVLTFSLEMPENGERHKTQQPPIQARILYWIFV